MKVRIDNEADAIYIYIQEIELKVADTIIADTIIADEFCHLDGMINFDIDSKGYVIGIEMLPIDFLGNLDNIHYYFESHDKLKVIISDNNITKKYSIYNDKIIIFIDSNDKIASIEIIDIFDKNNFSEKLVVENI